MDMKDFGVVDYTKNATPSGYKCSKCGATGCKLWRDYQTFIEHKSLLCAECAAEDQEEDISTINHLGMRQTEMGLSDQIGWKIPAVPTEDGRTFWGYTSVPPAGCEWWKNLRTLRYEVINTI